MNASNKEASQEASTRSEATARKATKELIAEIRRAADDLQRALRNLREHLASEPTDLQREHVERRTARKARYAEEAAKVNRAREQKEEQVMEAYEIVGPKELAEERQKWQTALGSDYQVIVTTHHMVSTDYWTNEA